jgi:hypothetical protein
MSDGGIADIRVGAMGEPELLRLIAVGEPGGVELKIAVPKKGGGLARSVAAFANSGGGWLLLGVADDGSVAGFAVPGTAHAHDWLRDHLQPAIDPLPAFHVATVPTADGDVLAVRIPRSDQAPHVLRDSGVVMERIPGSSRPIDSQAKLLALSRAADGAEGRAEARLRDVPRIKAALDARMIGPAVYDETRMADWHVAATPLHLPERFGDAMLRHAATTAMKQRGAAALQALTAEEIGLHSQLRPVAGGYVIEGMSLHTRDEMELTVDEHGATVTRWSTRVYRGVQHLPWIADHVLTPLLELAVAPLVAGGADGAVHVIATLHVRSVDRHTDPLLTVSSAGGSLELSTPQALEGRLAAPSAEEVRRLAEGWWRRLARAAGFEAWES